MQSESSLTASLRTLALLSPSDGSPTSPETYSDIICTIAEELDPSFVPPSSSASLEPIFETFLRRIGYTGDATSHLSVLSFLASTLRAHRIVALRRANSKPPPDPRDAMLASAVSRLQASLPHPQRSAPETSAHLAALLKVLVLASSQRISTLGGPESACGKPLLDAAAVQQRRDTCEAVRKELIKEHDLRKRMLLHRLEVTVRAFARGKHANATGFDAMMEGVTRKADEEGDVSMFEALAAREWALVSQRTHARTDEDKGVKTVVMGAVPDRGGRVGRAHGADMPGFRQRVASAAKPKPAFRKGKGGKRRR